MFYEKDVLDLKQDPKCYKCGKPLSVASAEKKAKMKQFLGKTTLVITLILVSITSYAQLKVEHHKVTLYADTMNVRQAFELLHYMIPKTQKIEKVVIKDGRKYVQSRWLINRMLKRYAYTERNGKVKLVRI